MREKEIPDTESRPRMPRVSGALLRMQPDERLAALAGEGNRVAFEELAERYRTRLVSFAGSIAPPSDADDVVQDSMLKAWMALSRGDEPGSPKSWLYTIVRNTALNHRRAYRPHADLDDTAAAGDAIDAVEQPPQAAERHSRFRSLVSGLRELPASQREAIVQRELEGRGHDEIAGRLGVTPAAVRQLIFRARESLRAGAAAVVPLSLLRLVSMPVAEHATAGLGASTAKLGVTAVVAAGLLVGGDKVVEQVDGGAPAQEAEAAAEDTADPAASTAPASRASRSDSERSAASGRTAGAELSAVSLQRETIDGQRLDRRPPAGADPHGLRPGTGPGDGGQADKPPPSDGGAPAGGGSGGAGATAPPPDGGGHHGGTGLPPLDGGVQLPPG